MYRTKTPVKFVDNCKSLCSLFLLHTHIKYWFWRTFMCKRLKKQKFGPKGPHVLCKNFCTPKCARTQYFICVWYFTGAHIFFRQPIFRQPFLGLGSAGICFFGGNTFFGCRKCIQYRSAFFGDKQFSTTIFGCKSTRSRICWYLFFWRGHIFRLSKVHPIRQ